LNTLLNRNLAPDPTHLEVGDLKMEESWLNNTFERRLGEAIAKPPKARTVARLCRAGL
jgi:hypothetical protein